MVTNDIIDQATLDELLDSLGGDHEFLAELIETFFEDTPVQLTAIHQALESGDAEIVRRAAHSLKSNSASFGAMHMHKLCKELEDIGKNGVLDDAARLTAEIETEYQRVHDALAAY
jgi:HPt (histidine-containing phosphotransfer) domain-containing protein